jgi:hypothetical protein
MLLRNALAAAAILCSAACGAAESRPDTTWMTGYWHMTADEDNGPVGGVIEFRPDGTYIGYDRSCNPYPTAEFHVYRDNIYVISIIPGKGPVSVIFHPNSDRSTLTFTSARTHNNAVYERLPGDSCRVQS